jgi:hypothetical protein
LPERLRLMVELQLWKPSLVFPSTIAGQVRAPRQGGPARPGRHFLMRRMASGRISSPVRIECGDWPRRPLRGAGKIWTGVIWLNACPWLQRESKYPKTMIASTPKMQRAARDFAARSGV